MTKSEILESLYRAKERSNPPSREVMENHGASEEIINSVIDQSEFFANEREAIDIAISLVEEHM